MPTSELERLRQNYQREMAAGSATCPTEEELASLLLEELDGPTRQELTDHVIGCRRCATSFRLLRELHLAAGAKPRGRASRRWPIWAAAAVVGLLAVGLPLYFGVREPRLDGPADTVRGPAAAAEEIVPADGEVLQQAPRRFVWPPQVGATGYQMRFYDESAELLWEGPVTQRPTTTLPPTRAARIGPGGAYFWTVQVNGQVSRQRLGPFWFRIQE